MPTPEGPTRSVERILVAATKLLVRQGYARTSLSDVATEAGVAKGTVHHHFPKKARLIRRVLQRACASATEHTEPRDEVRIVIELILQSLHEHTLRAPLAAYYRSASARLEAQLRARAPALRSLSRTDVARVSRCMKAVLDGLSIQIALDPGALRAGDVTTVLDIVLSALVERATA